jgi:hypothetical protein
VALPPTDEVLMDQLSAGERNNLVYLCLRHVVGWDMRGADLAVCEMMAGPDATREELIRVVADYAWDHLLGEPKKPTEKSLERKMVKLIQHWVSRTTPEERQRID